MTTQTTDTGPHKVNYDLKLLGSLLTPSTLSGFLCVLLSLLTVGSILVLTNYQGSSFQQDVLRYQDKTTQEAVEEDYDDFNSGFQENIIINRAPVMVFWMFVGTLVYLTLMGSINAIGGVNELGHELSYVHIERKQLLKEVFVKAGIRFVVLAVWLAIIILFFRVLLPYCLAAARVGGGNITSLMGIGYALLALAVLVICLHVHVVMLRLAALKPRIFSQETSF